MQHSQLGVKVAGQSVAQSLGLGVTREDQADAARVIWAGLFAGVMEAEHRLGCAQGRKPVHLDDIGRLIMLQIIVALQWSVKSTFAGKHVPEKGLHMPGVRWPSRQCMQTARQPGCCQ